MRLGTAMKISDIAAIICAVSIAAPSEEKSRIVRDVGAAATGLR